MTTNMIQEDEVNTSFCVYLGANKEWRITADAFQFILCRKITPKKKGVKTYYRTEGYYTNLGHLLETLAEKKLRESEVKTLKGMEKQLRLIRDDVAEYKKVVLK